MSQEPEATPPPSANDEVIGRALRTSLLALIAIGLFVAAIMWWRSRAPEATPETVIESEAPVTVQSAGAIPEVRFTDVTAEAGIDFVHTNGAHGEKLLPESMGGGVAFFDFDQDLDVDLLWVNSTTWAHSRDSARGTSGHRLYENDGKGSFRDVTRERGLALDVYGTGVAVGDFDNDGRDDLFLTAVGTNRLFANRPEGFVDVTAQAAVGGDDDAWSTSAAFVDFDDDGWLDLFVGNYVEWSKEIDFQVDYRLTGIGRAYGPPVNYQGTFSSLYRNRGDGTFEDVSAAAGIQIRNDSTGVPVGKALGVAPIDIDGDAHMDLFVANDTVRNFLFHNQADGTFLETAELYGLAYGRSGEATGAMGVDAARYRNDPELGFAIGNFANEMTSLYISQGDPTLYTDEAIGDGVGAPSRTRLSFGILFLDYDLDGRLDLLQTNGHLENEIQSVDPSQSYAQPSQLFWNAGPEARQTFAEVDLTTTGDLAQPLVGRASAYADIDADGDLDLAISQTGRRGVLLRNDQQLGHHWVRLLLRGRTGTDRNAIGSEVELTAGGVTQYRQVTPARSYQGQSELALTFGMGTLDRIDQLRIQWPDGSVEILESVEIDQLSVIEQAAESIAARP